MLMTSPASIRRRLASFLAIELFRWVEETSKAVRKRQKFEDKTPSGKK